MFEKKVILKNNRVKVTLVKEVSTDCCSIGVCDGGKPACKFISKELYDKLLEELGNQTEF